VPVRGRRPQRARHLGIPRVRGERLHRGGEMVWGSVEVGESKVFKLASPS
jgi:hypothetical protein